MTDEQLNELTRWVRLLCPGHRSVDIVHLGRHRVRVSCSMGTWNSTFLVNLDEDEEHTKGWARVIANRMNQPVTA